MAGKDELRQLRGRERAAVLMLALGEEYGAKLWTMLDEDEIRDLSQAMASLGTIGAQTVERLLMDFVSQLSTTGALVGSYESTERLLCRFLPKDRVEQIMTELRGPAGRTMWDKLGNVNETLLANYLKNEYPQTVAVVLSKLRPEHAARVLAVLPQDFAVEVITRMLRMETVQKDILDKVEQTLRVEFMSNLARTSRRDAHEMMAEIFNNFDRGTEGRFMAELEERNREVAERIRAASRRCCARSTRTSSRLRSRAPRRACATCSSPTCPSVRARSCARTWRRWGRCACATSTKRR